MVGSDRMEPRLQLVIKYVTACDIDKSFTFSDTSRWRVKPWWSSTMTDERHRISNNVDCIHSQFGSELDCCAICLRFKPISFIFLHF